MNKLHLLCLTLLCTSATAQKAVTAAKPNGPEFVASPILTISLKAPVVTPTEAQAKDRLLWYSGKKLNDSTLITTKATLVRWSKQRDLVIVQPKKDAFAKMAAALGNTQKSKDQLYKKIAEHKTSVMFYPAIMAAFNELDAVTKKYSDALKNTINLPPAVQNTGYNSLRFKRGGTASVKMHFSAGIPEYIKRAYRELMSSVKNYPSIDFAAPPATDFGFCLNYCDSSKRETNDDLEAAWQKAFVAYEAGIIETALGIAKQITILHLENDPEAAELITGLNKAMALTITWSSRWMRRITM